MRTTLTLDDDLAAALKERARVSGASFKEVVNDCLRAGLAAGATQGVAAERFRVEARARGFRPGVDPRRLNQLVDEIELAAHPQGLDREPDTRPDLASRVHEPPGERGPRDPS